MTLDRGVLICITKKSRSSCRFVKNAKDKAKQLKSSERVYLKNDRNDSGISLILITPQQANPLNLGQKRLHFRASPRIHALYTVNCVWSTVQKQQCKSTLRLRKDLTSEIFFSIYPCIPSTVSCLDLNLLENNFNRPNFTEVGTWRTKDNLMRMKMFIYRWFLKGLAT